MQAITPPFQVTIADDLMTIRHFHDGHLQMLGLIDVSQSCHFALDGQSVIYLGELGQLIIQAPESADASALLDCIESAVTHHNIAKHRRTLNEVRRRARRGSIAAGAVILTLVAVMVATAFFGKSVKLDIGILDHEASRGMSAYSGPQALAQKSSNIHPAALPMDSGDTAASRQPITSEMASVPVEPSPDGWALPESVRTVLPTSLQMAAQRKVFTVEYSSGHARTLYVFADPECPNCQRLEPALEAAAKDFNVVVFPVAVIGREKSIASITPVLCLPPEQRKAAWSDLFDVGHGVMDLGKAKESAAVEPGHCDIAGKALGVNEVAYQTYRIPGTPWAIADDGRHVSQEVLQNPLKLQAFMGAAEVSHAAQ